MKIETVGSFLPDERLIEAKENFERGIIDRRHLNSIEDDAVRDLVERQLACGVPYITSGELRRKHWANDFWFGLRGISCEHVSSGHIFQPVEASTDLIHITGRIGFDSENKFFIPLNPQNNYAIEVLRHVPNGKNVVLGIVDAHSPLSDDIASLSSVV